MSIRREREKWDSTETLTNDFKEKTDLSRNGDDDREVLINLLRSCSLSRTEANLYLGLIQHGPSWARILSQRVGVNRVETYRILKRLSLRGLVNVRLGDPSSFEAATPEAMLRILLREAERNARKVREVATEIILRIATVRNSSIDSDDRVRDPSFKLLRGENAQMKATKMYEKATKSIVGIWSVGRLTSAGLLRPFMESVKNSVQTQIICDMTKKNLVDVEELLTVANVRHYKGIDKTLRFTVIDGAEVILGATSMNTDPSNMLSLWSDSPDLAGDLARHFQALWKDAELAQGKIRQLTEVSENYT